jgi:hypothetical protein
MKVKTITLLNELFKLKQLCVYVVKGKLHMKVMQEMHVLMVRHHREKTVKAILSKRHNTLHAHLCEVPTHQINVLKKLGYIESY